MERKKITLIILIIILITLWSWQLKPKKKKASVEPIIEEKEVIAGIDLKTIEENLSQIKRKLVELENSREIKIDEISRIRNPLKPWISKKETSIIQMEEKKTEKPNFNILGIVYDIKKPYAIIDNNVKEEGERIGNFIIYKIYPEKIILKDETGNFFTLNFELEKGGENGK